MKNSFCRLVVIAFILFCSTFSPVVWGEDSERVQIETIRNLSLSGYNDDKQGALQWRLKADAANVDPKEKSKDIKSAIWNLQQLKLSTFGKDGSVFAEMTSPEGRFVPEKREADSNAKVEVRGRDFIVRGIGWSWSGEGHENLIHILGNVFVSISLPDKNENVTVVSKQLSIHGRETQTILTFSGNVTVFYGDIFMSCDALEIIVPDKGYQITKLGDNKTGSELDAIRQITGRGNLKISRGTAHLYGDFVEFLPPENLFFVRGNAHLDDVTSQISVRGDEAIGKIKQSFIEIIAKKPNTSLPLSPVAVSVEMPSIVDRKKATQDRALSTKTIVTGKRMTVNSSKTENVISLFDEVRVTDQDIQINADKLVVTVDPSERENRLEAMVSEGKDDLNKVRLAVAEGNVRADYLGRVLHCGRADVFPKKNRITVTGTPRIVSQEEGASLQGEYMEVYLDRDLIEIFSEKGHMSDRRRVTVELPQLTGISNNSTTTTRARSQDESATRTRVVGDHLTLTRGDNSSTFDIFGNVSLSAENLNGRCSRLVVFADPKTAEKNKGSSKRGVSQIKKIIADGEVELEQNGYVLTGGRATITPSVELKEWLPEDKLSDEDSPTWVVIEPDADTGDRPRITFPGDSMEAPFGFALPLSATQEKGITIEKAHPSSWSLTQEKNNKPHSTKKTYLESDFMELVAGDVRARFFLRGNVILATEGGAHGTCSSVEGLVVSRSLDLENSTRGFDVKKMICRGNVRLVHDGSTGQGAVLEIFPLENRAVLSGDAYFREKSGVMLRPGNDRFVFDLTTRQVLTGTNAGSNEDAPGQVSRPRIIIPKGSDRVFIIPKSVQKKTEK